MGVRFIVQARLTRREDGFCEGWQQHCFHNGHAKIDDAVICKEASINGTVASADHRELRAVWKIEVRIIKRTVTEEVVEEPVDIDS